ncbi:MAG: hypothetical protein FJ104_13090, partial [Deltaproteobacteria bacterium]|nr:hypothetical protein [Deltaproteobacteria bacterium]
MSSTPEPLLARVTPRGAAWIAVLVSLVAFLPGLTGGWVFDDLPLIAQNPYAQDLGHLGRCFVTDLWDTPERPDPTGSVRFYRPIVCASYVLNWQLSREPWAFHAVNVALHALATWLASRFATRFSGSALGGLLAGALFAVHPVRTENVLWISGRTDLLMGLFLLGAVELAVRGAAAAGRLASLGGSVGLFALGVLSKEYGVVFPLLLGLEALAARDRGERGPARRLALLGGLCVVLAVAYLAVRAAVFPIRPPELADMAPPLGLHAAYVALSVGYYVERLFLPWPQIYDFRPVALTNGAPDLFLPSVVVGVATVAVALVALLRVLRRDRTLALAIAVTGLLFVPLVNVSYTGFPGTAADRFLYLPLLALAAVGVRAGAPLLARLAARPLAPLLLASATLVASAVCWVRALDYVDDLTWWEHELEVNPDDPNALSAIVHHVSERDPELAFELVQRALSPAALRYTLIATPGRYYMGLLGLHAGRLADGNAPALAALLAEMRGLLERTPSPGTRRSGDLVLAPPADPHLFTRVANDAGALRVAAALVASRLGEDAAVVELARGIRVDAPLGPSARYNLALALARAGAYPEVEGALEAMLASSGPGFGEAAAALRGMVAA